MLTLAKLGNTIFLGLGASNQPLTKPFGWLKSLISISFFLVGSFTFSNMTRNYGPRRRRTISTSFFVQTICLIIGAALVQSNYVPDPTGGSTVQEDGLFKELIPLGFLAFGAGGQLAASRLLGFNEIPTVVLTSVYYDIASDVKLTQGVKANVKRNRRMGAVVSLLIGAIGGGWISRSDAGMPTVLWIAAGLKLFISIGWLFWKGEQPDEGK
ncbi:MAG: hypothetical protein M1834_009404 [Cirrosporium novae-zelandiae]|nr:MAG: hypothetical protein M1834_009404 [Cirrosporium novae-zelandiae]